MAQLKDMTRIQVLKQIDLQKRLNDEVGRAIWLNTTLANIGDFLTQPRTIKENLHPFENALFALQDGFKKKTLTSARLLTACISSSRAIDDRGNAGADTLAYVRRAPALWHPTAT